MPVDPSVKELSPSTVGSLRSGSSSITHVSRLMRSVSTTTSSSTSIRTASPMRRGGEVLEYVDNPVMKRNAQHDLENAGVRLYVPHSFPGGAGFGSNPAHGRIFHQEGSLEQIGVEGVDREVALGLRSMDAMASTVRSHSPTTLLGMGMSPLAGAEAHIAYAYNRWMIERFCSQSPRLTFMPYLPMRDVDMCRRIVRETADQARSRGLHGHEHPLPAGPRQLLHGSLRGDRGDQAATRIPRRPDVGRRLDEDDEPIHLRSRPLVCPLQSRALHQLDHQRSAGAVPRPERGLAGERLGVGALLDAAS